MMSGDVAPFLKGIRHAHPHFLSYDHPLNTRLSPVPNVEIGLGCSTRQMMNVFGWCLALN